jgi:nucleoside-diphosphate-sugar epimerase
MMHTALVVGARGQIGRFLLPQLAAAGWQTHALTRAAPPLERAGRDWPDPHWSGVQWHQVDLRCDAAPPIVADVVFGLGPLDAFGAWLARSALRPTRVIAFSSTSAETKRASDDPHEVALAQRLVAAEQALLDWSSQVNAHATVLRPTLIYGAGLDRNLTRVAQLAQRWGVLLLPRGATGLRQPVHAADLADAAWSAAQRTLPRSRYDLPGGETLSYHDMVKRVLACLEPPRRLFELPPIALRVALRLAHRFGAMQDAGESMLARLRTDLVFDPAAATRDFDYRPRRFTPRAEMFVAPETI